jgi:dihydrofolate reductase
VADFVAELRQQDGGTIGTAGSPSLVRSLIDQGLLDELTLMISPVVAGGGRKRLFADDAMRRWVPRRPRFATPSPRNRKPPADSR